MEDVQHFYNIVAMKPVDDAIVLENQFSKRLHLELRHHATHPWKSGEALSRVHYLPDERLGICR